jgi:hypothetical protein
LANDRVSDLSNFDIDLREDVSTNLSSLKASTLSNSLSNIAKKRFISTMLPKMVRKTKKTIDA